MVDIESPGTLTATSDAQASASRGRAAFDAELAKIRAEQAADGEEPAAAAPVAAAPEAVDPEAAAAPEADGYSDEGIDSLVAALDPRAEGAQRRAGEAASIETEALELGLPASMAKLLAHNTPRKNAREILAEQREKLQSGHAVQSAPAPTPPVEVASPGPVTSRAPAEVMEALRESLGDEAAQAVADGVLSPLLARIAQLEQGQQVVAQTVEQARATEMRSQVLTVAGELAGEFPALVRGDRIDPAVAGLAADLLLGQTYGGNVKAALEAAARLTYGSVTKPRQKPTSASGPETVAPPSEVLNPTQKISGLQKTRMLSEVERKYAGDESKIRAEYARIEKIVKQHNARVR